MIVARVLLGDFDQVKVYDEKKYKGTNSRPVRTPNSVSSVVNHVQVRRPPEKPNQPGITYDSVLAERKAWGGCVTWREFVTYDR